MTARAEPDCSHEHGPTDTAEKPRSIYEPAVAEPQLGGSALPDERNTKKSLGRNGGVVVWAVSVLFTLVVSH